MIPILLKLALYAAVAGLAVAGYHWLPLIGPHARLERLAASRDAWHESSRKWELAAGGWRASFTQSEGLRKAERTDAITAVNDEQDKCLARVSEARRSAQAIRVLVDRPVKVDGGGCPVRSTVSADDLRAALGAR